MKRPSFHIQLNNKPLALIAIGLVFITINVGMLWEWWSQGKQNLELSRQISEKEAIVAALEPAALTNKPSQQEVDKVVAQLPPLDAQPNWIYDMHSLILKTGVKVDLMNFERTEREENRLPMVQVLTTDIELEGTLPQFISVIRSIQQMPRITHIEQWSINQGEGNPSYHLKVANYFNSNVPQENLESKPIPSYSPRLTNP
jgi:Tfp pilus assembly protein PilO